MRSIHDRFRCIRTFSTAVAAVALAASLPPARFAAAGERPATAPMRWVEGEEVVARRDRWGSTVRGETPGTYETTLHSKPVNYEPPDGSWQPIDLTARTTGTGQNNPDNPLAPSKVRARRGDRSAFVTWTAPTVGTGISEYQVTAYRHSNDAVVTTVLTSAAATSKTVTGLSNGIPVYFTVAAMVGPLPGPKSPRSNAVTPAGLPGTPTNVSAALTGGDGHVRVSWSRPSDNGDAIRHYVVNGYSTSAGLVSQRTVASSPQTITGLTFGETYYFAVKAVNGVGAGNASGASNTLVVRGVPLAPTNASAAQRGTTNMMATWTGATARGAAITKYVVTAHPGGRSVTVSGTATAAIVDRLKLGSEYRLRIAAYSSVGRGRATVTNRVRLATPPDQPPNIKATAGAAKVTVTWSAANPNGLPVTSYTVYDTSLRVAKELGRDARSWTFKNLSPGDRYTFRVYATNGRGAGVSGTSNTVTVGPAPPSEPEPASPTKPGGGEKSGTLRQRIVQRATLEDQFNKGVQEQPMGSDCNIYTKYWGVGRGCSNGLRAQAWCADFARWVWKSEGVDTTGANSSSGSFKTWAQSRERKGGDWWHPAGSGYKPKPGDAIVWYDYYRRRGHVALVIEVKSDLDVVLVNGNYRQKVYRGTKEYKGAGGGYYQHSRGTFQGFASPVSTA